MSSQGIMSSKKSGNNPGLCPCKWQKSGLNSWTRAQNHLLSLSVSTDKSPPHYHMLVIYPTFYLFPYILPRNCQGWLLSNKMVTCSVSCKLVGSFISSYPRMSRDPKQSYSILGGNVIQHLLALLYQWGLVLMAWRAFKAAWLSEQILTYFSDIAFAWIAWAQAKILSISAWKTVAYFPREIMSLLPKDCL